MSGCSTSPGTIDRTLTEGGRIANLLTNTRACMAAEALAKARALGSGKACGALCGVSQAGPQVPVPSMLLNATVKNCFNKYQTLEGCVPESIRIARLQQRTLDMSIDATNPGARFSEYARNFPAPCPPIPASYINAGQPILQGSSCGLPNKPGNPVLPI
jgi:hypothetical protein